jgi:hypothetical protein
MTSLFVTSNLAGEACEMKSSELLSLCSQLFVLSAEFSCPLQYVSQYVVVAQIGMFLFCMICNQASGQRDGVVVSFRIYVSI